MPMAASFLSYDRAREYSARQEKVSSQGRFTFLSWAGLTLLLWIYFELMARLIITRKEPPALNPWNSLPNNGRCKNSWNYWDPVHRPLGRELCHRHEKIENKSHFIFHLQWCLHVWRILYEKRRKHEDIFNRDEEMRFLDLFSFPFHARACERIPVT